MKKKRNGWDRFIWAFQHPIGWERAKGIALAHRRRILRENIENDYRLHKEEYDREFEKDWMAFLIGNNIHTEWDGLHAD